LTGFRFGGEMARIPEEEIERLKREVSVERLARGRGIEIKARGVGGLFVEVESGSLQAPKEGADPEGLPSASTMPGG
jgi:hypothetical protein